jgi:hypothetical protein
MPEQKKDSGLKLFMDTNLRGLQALRALVDGIEKAGGDSSMLSTFIHDTVLQGTVGRAIVKKHKKTKSKEAKN